MYVYDAFDQSLVDQRVAEFRDQVQRRLAGELTEEQFKPLRLMNGLYLQLHAYMLRVAIPYGSMTSKQLRALADIARRFDRGYGHFTTRQNIQYNWVTLKDAPDILEALAKVRMHAIQTSGNVIRNVTADHFAGAAAGELEDPRVHAEIIRQWSTFHPEFSFLPRKFKIALTGDPHDRAAVKLHDIGLRMHRAPVGHPQAGKVGFEVLVGGGQGRTPMIAPTVREFLPRESLLSYLEAIMRVYNRFGRRDNKYKARIKILVHELGIEAFRAAVEAEWQGQRERPADYPPIDPPEDAVADIRNRFKTPDFEALSEPDPVLETMRANEPEFAAWLDSAVDDHRQPGYAIVSISLKPVGGIPGDATAEQMEAVADLGERFGHDEIRVSHIQNLVLPHVRQRDLPALWAALRAHDLATPNVGRAGDIIACPGLDYCALANARSIPLARDLSRRLNALDAAEDLGDLQVKISGCINACGHHHVGHIGILGVDKKGEEFYQVTLGGRADEHATIGKIVGAAFSASEIAPAIETVARAYIAHRRDGESFLETCERLGLAPFKSALYPEIADAVD